MPSDTTKVRVVDRRSWSSPVITTVSISKYCPQCGQQRGAPVNHGFVEDGVWYTCDIWSNPCGHIDWYSDVLREAREGVS